MQATPGYVLREITRDEMETLVLTSAMTDFDTIAAKSGSALPYRQHTNVARDVNKGWTWVGAYHDGTKLRYFKEKPGKKS